MFESNEKEENLDNFAIDNSEIIKRKKHKRIFLIISLIIILLIITIIIIAVSRKNNKTNPEPEKNNPEPEKKDPQEVPNNYIDLEDNEGVLEKQFSKMGEFNIGYESIKFIQNQKYNHIMFYPKIENEIQINGEIYPVIIFINNLGKSYKINQPIFKHLASYGFIVIVNDDENSLNGESTREILENLENLNQNENFKFFNKLDLNNIGISCHDKSIISLLKIANDTILRQKVKSIFCAAPLSQKEILLEKYYYFYKNMTFQNIFMVTSYKDIKFQVPKEFSDILMVIPRNTYKNALISTKNLTTRDNILWKSDSYHTAWYLSTLKNNESANRIFIGNNCEILNNTIWNNVTIRNEIQKTIGDKAIYISDNFRDYIHNEDGLEDKFSKKGNMEIGTYEFLCDPNLEKCLKTNILNYIIYYPLELINNNDKKYPLIVFSNALNFGYFYITPLLEHLASWGFVVIANDEGESFLSIGVRESLKYMISFNNDINSIFYNKIQLENIGLSGHSSGASGILYYTNFEYNDELKNLKIKSLFPSCLNTMSIIKNFFKIDLDFSKVSIPYIFLTSSEDEISVISNDDFKKNMLNKFSGNIYQFLARKKNTIHHNFYWNSIGYQTAWFLYTLTNDEDAKSIFEPKPEGEICSEDNINGICSNSLWSDILYSNKTFI